MSDRYVAFYSAKPFWAISALDLSELPSPESFHDRMQEVVFRHEEDFFKLLVCKDGKILLNIPAFEEEAPFSEQSDLSEAVLWWNKYLRYLNALYLLLDSCTIQVMNISFVEITELTRKDAIRVELDGDKFMGENIAHESYASAYQLGTFLSMYGQPPQFDIRMIMRQVIIYEVFECLAKSASAVFMDSDTVRWLSTITKALSEYKSGNYDLSLVISWFVVESKILEKWNSHLQAINETYEDGSKKINTNRMANLTEGRDYPVSVISNQLELIGVIQNDQFKKIDRVRGYRNNVVHQDPSFICTDEHAQESLRLAVEMALEDQDLELVLNYSYGVHGP